MNPLDYLYVSRAPDAIVENNPHDYTFLKNEKAYAHCRRLIHAEKAFGENVFLFCTTYINTKREATIWEICFQQNETCYAIECFVSNAFRRMIFYYYEFHQKEFLETDQTPFEGAKEQLVSLIIEHPAHRLFFATGDVEIQF